MMLLQLLALMRERNASDLILKAGCAPHLRVNTVLHRVSGPVPTPEDVEEGIREVLPAYLNDVLSGRQEADFSFELPELGRFRGTIFRQQGHWSMVVRVVRSDIPSFEQLHVPGEVLSKLASERRGLILVCGATGSGKSTTIAAMIEYMNQHMKRHIITIEDPIEHVFTDRKSVISQRELGLDTEGYGPALRHAMLQSPDVIYIGNIRDQATTYAALTAAETGHLILSTVHSLNVVQAIERVVNFFPPHQHQEIQLQLSLLLKGVVAQRLIPRVDTNGVIPAIEVMVHTPTTARLVREAKTAQISEFMEDGAMYGMQSFNQSLVSLVQEGLISPDQALVNADSADELKLRLDGVQQLKDVKFA